MPAPLPPPPDVLRRFGVDDDVPVPLPGGRRTAWSAGTVVLKPLDMSLEALAWQAGLLRTLDQRREGFRVSVPLRTTDGSWTAAGWTGWRYEPGHRVEGAWADVIAAGRRFHRALEGVPAPPHLAEREDPWAVADRIAWAELPPGRADGTPHLARLLAAARPVALPPALVHGDLTGNVLFDEGLPPLVLDFSPYWRPPGFASAVVVVDALVNEGAPPTIVRTMDVGPDRDQFLLRALIFRLVADHLLEGGAGGVAARSAPAVELVTSLLQPSA